MGEVGGRGTRAHFLEELRELEEQALGGLDLVADQLDRTLEAVQHQDIELAAMVIGDDADTREWAMHMMLVARALERIGDNAVDIGEQVAFVVTGLFREFTDASHPAEAAPPAV